jgi:hypothetical protein
MGLDAPVPGLLFDERPNVQRMHSLVAGSLPRNRKDRCSFVTRFDKLANFNFKTPPEKPFFTMARSLRLAFGINIDVFDASVVPRRGLPRGDGFGAFQA